MEQSQQVAAAGLPRGGQEGPRRSRRLIFRALTLAVSLSLSLVSLEALSRLVLSFYIGARILSYGTGAHPRQAPGSKRRLRGSFREMRRAQHLLNWDRTIQGHGLTHLVRGGDGTTYWKFAPRQRQVYPPQWTGRRGPGGPRRAGRRPEGQWEVTINDQGFRGADFSVAKPEGTYRVVTLGASSTFGFKNADDQTYPYYLQQILEGRRVREGCGAVRAFEVLNLGIPHLGSAEILSLLRNEALAFSPDMVTFYEGLNDAGLVARGPWGKLLSDGARRLIIVYALRFAISHWMDTFSAEELRQAAAGRGEAFITSVAAMEEAARGRGIRFLVIYQQVTSLFPDRAKLGRTTHAQEAAQIRARLALGGRMTLEEMPFMLHAMLLEKLRRWVSARRIDHLDFIRLQEQQGLRGAMSSHVHLRPRANRLLATALAGKVWQAACGGSSRAPLRGEEHAGGAGRPLSAGVAHPLGHTVERGR